MTAFEWLKTEGVKHGKALAIAGVLVFGGRMWIQEHDARLQADTQVKSAQTMIADLRSEQANVLQAAKAKVVVLRTEAATVKTATVALERLPEVSVPAFNLAPAALPESPDRVSVQAVPLYQELNACRQCDANLEGETRALELERAVSAQKDVEITALKKKPSFWKRAGKAAKVIGCAAGGGAVGSLAGSKGAAIGAAAGAGLCQAF